MKIPEDYWTKEYSVTLSRGEMSELTFLLASRIDAIDHLLKRKDQLRKRDVDLLEEEGDRKRKLWKKLMDMDLVRNN